MGEETLKALGGDKSWDGGVLGEGVVGVYLGIGWQIFGKTEKFTQ